MKHTQHTNEPKPIRPYKHINKRIQNIPTGCLGRISLAGREPGKKMWEITVQWDDGSFDSTYTSSNFFQYNAIVPEHFRPDYGPLAERAKAMLARLEEGDLPFQFGYITHVSVGKDSLSYWHPRFSSCHIYTADFFGEARSVQSEHSERNMALLNFKDALQEVAKSGVLP